MLARADGSGIFERASCGGVVVLGIAKCTHFVSAIFVKKIAGNERVIYVEVVRNTSMCKGVIPELLVMRQGHDGVRYRMRSWMA